MKGLALTALIIMLIGALNWGLVGLFNFNLVSWIFGFSPILERLVYIVVGLAGIYGITMAARLAEGRDDVCVPGHELREVPHPTA